MNMNGKLKRATSLLLALLMMAGCLSFAACSIRFGDGEKEKDDRPYVVCTVFPQYDFISNIVGDKMRVEMLLSPGSETHAFTLSSLSLFQIEEFYEADLFVFVGGDGDGQLMAEMQKTIKTEAPFLTLLSFVSDPLCADHEEEGEHEHEHEHAHEEEYDEHVWTSPKRVIEVVDGLCAVLSEIDPENAALYAENTAAYKEKLAALDQKFEKLKEEKTFDTVIFADRYPFRYLCEDYGIKADAAFSGCSTAVEPSLSVLSDLYKKAEQLKLPAILYIENSNPAYAEDIAKKTGGKALMLHSCHMPSKEEYGKKDYIAIMEENLETLRYALGAGKDLK